MKDDSLYFIHILECIERIEDYTSEGKTHFLGDQKTQDAVVRNFEIMGEAAKRVSKDGRALAPTVPWKQIAGFRDILIHQYEGVDPSEVWQIIEKEMSNLKQALVGILKAKGINRKR